MGIFLVGYIVIVDAGCLALARLDRGILLNFPRG